MTCSRVLRVLVWATAMLGRVEAQSGATALDALPTVRACADAMIEHGRDRYGETHSPLFAATLDRHTLQLPEGEVLERIAGIPREHWGVRPHDRALSCANPMHDENLYQVLYALSKATGNTRYAEEADKALRWFLEHCQNPTTGLYAWGEHLSWDLQKETWFNAAQSKCGTHEFFRPWVLWDKCFDLAPEHCVRFARGLWKHQIGDPATGNFSRHAGYSAHEPGRDSEYPRHGGFYIATWAHAYQRTGDEQFLLAIDTLVSYFEGRCSPVSGALPCESAARSRGKTVWPESNLSLAVDLWESASLVPQDRAARMRAFAEKIDKVFLALAHDLGPGGKGFVKTADTDTLAPQGGYSRTWATGYGEATHGTIASLCLLRWRQVKLDGYRRLILATADRYCETDPDTSIPLYPGALADAVEVMLGAYEITEHAKYLERARELGAMAQGIFFHDAPLPKASSKQDHYEAITRGDTLVMELLKLWAVENRPELVSRLVYIDR